MKKLISALTIALAMMVSGGGYAATATYLIDQSNDLGVGNWATVKLTDNDTDIDFQVDIIQSSFDTAGASNFGMTNFSFNFDSSLSVSASNITNLNPADWTITTNQSAGGGFGNFDFQTTGDGTNRTLSLSFTISGVSDDSLASYAVLSGLYPESSDFFAMHIAGFNTTNGVTGAQFAGSTECPTCKPGTGPSVVPVPAAVWLFGSGLLGLIGAARRKSTTTLQLQAV